MNKPAVVKPLIRLPEGLTRENFTMPPVALTPEVEQMIADNSPVAIGISGGKDSQALAYSVVEHLDAVGHKGPRILIHSDLGSIEWDASLPACEDLAKRLNMELVVLRRPAGGMIERWETRWDNNVKRYAALECVTMILPWSTPAMRFCTSELKTSLICAELTRRFPNQNIISATGIRREESSARAKAAVVAPQPKLTARGSKGVNWNAIIEWKMDEVLGTIASRGDKLHPAYTEHGCSRVSCSFCIMSAGHDMVAAASYAGNHDTYRRLVKLEVTSGFGFQGSRWLSDVAPHLLDDATRAQVVTAKANGQLRIAAEARIPRELMFEAGYPKRLPTPEEAKILSEVRLEVAKLLGIDIEYTTPEEIIDRYGQLMDEKSAKDDARDAKDARAEKRRAMAP